MKTWLSRAAALACALLLAAGAPHAQTVQQFVTAPWVGFAPGRIQCGSLFLANFNTTADQAITIVTPAAYLIDSIAITAPSISMTTAQGGFYSAVSKGGVAIVASSQAYSSLTTSTENTTGNAMLATLSTAGNTTKFGGYNSASQQSTIYFSLTTAQGAAATADIRVYCRPLMGTIQNPY